MKLEVHFDLRFFCITKYFTIMRKFFEIMEKNIQKDGLTWTDVLVFGVAAPLFFVMVIGFFGWIETLCE